MSLILFDTDTNTNTHPTEQEIPSARMIDAATHVVSVAWTAMVVITFLNGTLFSFHPVLIAVGFGLFMANGIVFSKRARTVGDTKKDGLIDIHRYMEMAGMAVALGGGVGAIFYNKMLANKTHFTSWHSWWAVLSLVFCGLAIAGGIWAKNARDAQEQKAATAAIRFHRASGCVAFVLVAVAVVLGFETPGIHKGLLSYLMEMLFVLLLLLLLLPGVLENRYGFDKLAGSELTVMLAMVFLSIALIFGIRAVGSAFAE